MGLTSLRLSSTRPRRLAGGTRIGFSQANKHVWTDGVSVGLLQVASMTGLSAAFRIRGLPWGVRLICSLHFGGSS